MDDCNVGFSQGSGPDRNLHHSDSHHGRVRPFRVEDSIVEIHFHPADYTNDGTGRPDRYWCVLRLYQSETQQYNTGVGSGALGTCSAHGSYRGQRGTQKLRHESGAGCEKPRRITSQGLFHDYAAPDPLFRDHRCAAGVHCLF